MFSASTDQKQRLLLYAVLVLPLPIAALGTVGDTTLVKSGETFSLRTSAVWNTTGHFRVLWHVWLDEHVCFDRALPVPRFRILSLSCCILSGSLWTAYFKCTSPLRVKIVGKCCR